MSGPAAIYASEMYLEKAWREFTDWVSSVMTDPEQGPFALEAYLNAPDGLTGFLNETLSVWKTQYLKFRDQLIGQGEEMCRNSWGPFRNPPIHGRTGALAQYDHALKSLYTYVGNCQCLEKYTEALEKLIVRIGEYLRDGLKPLCETIRILEEEFSATGTSDAVPVQDVFSIGTVQDDIDEAFRKANTNGRLTGWFLQKLMDISARTTPSVDAKTSGVTFTCRQAGPGEICKALKACLEEACRSVNNRSLDDIMRAEAGDDAAAQEKWMEDLIRETAEGAADVHAGRGIQGDGKGFSLPDVDSRERAGLAALYLALLLYAYPRYKTRGKRQA